MTTESERRKTAAKAAANEKAAKVNYNLFRSSENERANESARRKKQKAKEGSIIAGHFKTEAQNVWSENKRRERSKISFGVSR